MALLGHKKTEELQLQTIVYPWAKELLDQAISNTWCPKEIPMADDLQDWKKMSEEEKQAVIMYIGFSNPCEFGVNEAITNVMMPFITAPEVQMYFV
mgnify:FL=1